MDFLLNNGYLINWYFPFILSFVLAWIIVYISVPVIIRVSKLKKLYDEPDGVRKLQTRVVPTLGGKAIFFGFTMGVTLASYNLTFIPLRYIIASLIILLFVGLKDDILYISARSKLVGQLFTAFILVVYADIRFTTLHGVFGIEEIPYVVSVFLSMFALIVLTNSLNLIDGIDGLCASIGIFASFCFGMLFYLNDSYNMVLVATSLCGALSAFFIYNVFGDRNKIFMGDTGSLLVGFILSMLTIRFNEIHLGDTRMFQVLEPPAIAFAIMVIPIMDTLRVFTVRIARGQSPFSADKIHTHHYLINLGLSHFNATLLYVAFNMVFIAIAMVLQHYLDNYILLAVLVLLALLILYIPIALHKKGVSFHQGDKQERLLLLQGPFQFFRKLADKQDTSV